MRKITAPIRFLGTIADRAAAAAGAVIAAQIPQLIAQYIQRLGGHVDELSRVVQQYRDAASASGKDLASYIRVFLDSGVTDFILTGKDMNANVERLAEISSALKELSASEGLSKFTTFLANIYPDILKSTLQNFVPGFPLTTEGLVYSLSGLVSAIVIIAGIKALFRRIFKKCIDRTGKQ